MIPSRNTRQVIRARRRELDADARRIAAEMACRHLVSLRRFRQARHLALYLAADGELDPLPVLERACAMGKHCYLPVLRSVGKGLLWFARWQPGDPLRANRYGIPEPEWTAHTLIRPWALNMIILPLVAFDADCNRMGMGGGYYDRSLAWRLQRRLWTGPMLVGYAYELQKLRHVHPSPWDVPLDAVITESTLYMR